MSEPAAAGVIQSPFPDEPIPENPHVARFVLDAILAHDQDAVAFKEAATGASLTFGELRQRVGSAATAWPRQHGLKRGDVVAIVLPNCNAFPVAFFSVSLAGGVLSTVNPGYTASEIHHQLVDSGARFVVTAAPLLAATVGQAVEGTSVERVFVGGLPDGEEPGAGVVRFESLLQHEAEASVFDAPHEGFDAKTEVAIVPYSSGTSGLPKGVLLTHHNLVANLFQLSAKDLIALDHTDVLSAVLPFFHIYGLVAIMFNGLRSGCKSVLLAKFDPTLFLSSIQDDRVTYLFIAPPIADFLGKHPVIDKFDLSSVRELFSGAAPLGEANAEACAKRLNASLRQGYGMTELSPAAIVFRSSSSPKYGSIGALLPNMQCRVVKPDSLQPADQGEEGEIWLRGPNVMKGYLNNDEATNTTIVEGGWLRTGDIGFQDKDGDFFITDRLKELIKVKGFQVAPAELEAVLKTHPAVFRAGVIGIPDERAGERPKAFVQLQPGVETPPTQQELIDFCAKDLSDYKKISEVVFVAEVPVSASGKILRRMLRDMEKKSQAGE